MCTCICACLLAAFKSVGMSSLLFCGKPCDTHLLATFFFFFVSFAVGILLSSAAATAMVTSTATNSVMCSEPSVSLSSGPSRSVKVVLRSCLRRSTDACTASVTRITFADTVVFKSKNGKVRRLCPRKVDKSVKRSCDKPLVLRQDWICNTIYCETGQIACECKIHSRTSVRRLGTFA